ncbi:hypothetical protein C5167_049562 [Papaver somniferum]|uniref:Uncharacterized protein n=1 Tax=Papaver somniferum TaxID=3469 RepID=A0A4Y7KL63_PAPSO|nr:hypothetical protein C5167_049562 [Papaver somniferum]
MAVVTAAHENCYKIRKLYSTGFDEFACDDLADAKRRHHKFCMERC